MDSDFEKYLQYEWEAFGADSARSSATLQAAAGLEVRRVLDIGCGAGQEMLPLIRQGALGIGLDFDGDAGIVGRRYFSPEQAVFAQASGEYLPLRGASVDFMICRLAIPYMDNALALSEMSRVLRPGGRLLLKIHAAPYYVHKFWTGVRNLEPLFSIHALRVLGAGALYHVRGKQGRGGLFTKEVFQSRRLLTGELQKVGMAITGEMPDTNRLTPSFIIVKR